MTGITSQTTLDKNNGERQALMISMAASLVMALIGIFFAALAKSNAVLLDGVYSLIAFLMAFITSRIAHIITLPNSTTFQFGYAAFEPFFNAFRGIIVSLVLIYAFISAFTSLFSGGREISTGTALIYTLTAGITCIVISRVQRKKSKRLDSSFLKSDSESWFVDGMISLCVGLAFLTGFVFQKMQYDSLINYIDPVIVMGMVLFIARDPFKTVYRNIGELLQIAPKLKIQNEINELIDTGIESFSYSGKEVRMLKVGKFFYVKIICFIKDPEQKFSVYELDAVRKSLEQSVQSKFPSARIDLSFKPEPVMENSNPELAAVRV